jgi:predicted O-methyltransferase YrrM
MNQAGHELVAPSARRWDFLAGLMQELGLKTFVEVGCKEGRTTGHILKTVPDARVIAIDPWIANPAPTNGDVSRETYEKWDFEKIQAEFWENVGVPNERCEMWRTTSLDAAENIGGVRDDVVPDIVFIDALHDHESVKQDIAAWLPLVRSGGVLALHDFNHKWPGVERAIAENFCLMDVGVGPDSVAFIVKP